MLNAMWVYIWCNCYNSTFPHFGILLINNLLIFVGCLATIEYSQAHDEDYTAESPLQNNPFQLKYEICRVCLQRHAEYDTIATFAINVFIGDAPPNVLHLDVPITRLRMGEDISKLLSEDHHKTANSLGTGQEYASPSHSLWSLGVREGSGYKHSSTTPSVLLLDMFVRILWTALLSWPLQTDSRGRFFAIFLLCILPCQTDAASVLLFTVNNVEPKTKVAGGTPSDVILKGNIFKTHRVSPTPRNMTSVLGSSYIEGHRSQSTSSRFSRTLLPEESPFFRSTSSVVVGSNALEPSFISISDIKTAGLSSTPFLSMEPTSILRVNSISSTNIREFSNRNNSDSTLLSTPNRISPSSGFYLSTLVSADLPYNTDSSLFSRQVYNNSVTVSIEGYSSSVVNLNQSGSLPSSQDIASDSMTTAGNSSYFVQPTNSGQGTVHAVPSTPHPAVSPADPYGISQSRYFSFFGKGMVSSSSRQRFDMHSIRSSQLVYSGSSKHHIDGSLTIVSDLPSDSISISYVNTRQGSSIAVEPNQSASSPASGVLPIFGTDLPIVHDSSRSYSLTHSVSISASTNHFLASSVVPQNGSRMLSITDSVSQSSHPSLRSQIITNSVATQSSHQLYETAESMFLSSLSDSSYNQITPFSRMSTVRKTFVPSSLSALPSDPFLKGIHSSTLTQDADKITLSTSTVASSMENTYITAQTRNNQYSPLISSLTISFSSSTAPTTYIYSTDDRLTSTTVSDASIIQPTKSSTIFSSYIHTTNITPIVKHSYSGSTISPGNTNTISPGKINTNTISPGKINTNTISPGKINTNTISPRKTNTNTISPGKINTNTISQGKINTNTISPGKINTNTISPGKINTNTISPGKINTNTISPGNTNRISPGNTNTNTISPGNTNTNTISPGNTKHNQPK